MKVGVLAGPTAVGKSEVALFLAKNMDLDIVSVDSRQVYTRFDIGTAKPKAEYRLQVTVHMIDRVEPSVRYTAADFARDALALMRRLAGQDRRFVLVGGSGLYIRAIFEPFFEVPKSSSTLRRRLESRPTEELLCELGLLDPNRARELHHNDRQRIVRALEVCYLTGRTMQELVDSASPHHEFEPFYVILNRPREELYRRINERFDAMMRAGLLDEVRQLRESGSSTFGDVVDACGYAELTRYLSGESTLGEAVERAKAKTRAYARRQLTWFRQLADAVWIDCRTAAETADAVSCLMRHELPTWQS